MSTALSNIRQTFGMNFVVTTVALVRTDPWVRYVLSYLVCCDCHIRVIFSVGSCACPLHCVFLVELGLIPFNLELTFTFLSLWSVGTSHTHSLTNCISHTLATVRVILLSSVWHRSQGITLRPTAGALKPNGLRSNWDFLPGRSPWHVGGSNTINNFLYFNVLFI